MAIAFKLGPFDLHEPIGSGGMGQVWSGVHRVEKVPVAVKVLTLSAAREPQTQAALRNEVRAVAGLDHPGIVTVHDYGRIPEDTAASGAVLAGSPYLVMELLGSRSLRRLVAAMLWPELRQMLLSLLDALAHAHARGVIHRDLKPSNILRARDGRLRLTDFGLAYALGGRTTEEAGYIAGTPKYMAPEQCRGVWRDFGPWTDLYALGCMAWELVTGWTPFTGPDPASIIAAHLREELPNFVPCRAVPPGLEAWLRRLLVRDPRGRYRRAADAAWGLRELGDVEGERGTHSFGDDEPTQTLTWSGSLGDGDWAPSCERVGERPPTPPVPAEWRQPERGGPGCTLLGAGLGLYWLRAIPLIGRDEERDILWKTLREVDGGRGARAVVLRGGPGVGKSHLAEWFCERAHELGTATVLKAVHGPAVGSVDGLTAMVSQHLRCAGLDRPDALRRVESALRDQGVVDAHEWEALTDVVAPSARSGEPAHHTRRGERHELLVRYVRRLASERPVIIWLDDVQWGIDALAFAQRYLDAAGKEPVLLLLTVRDEALVHRPAEARLLNGVLSRRAARMVSLGPLEPGLHHRLIRSLLHLEEPLARAVAELTLGNPLFAVQLLGDWVHRGVLRSGENGFRVEKEHLDNLPANIDEVWARRTAALLLTRTEDEGQALELAAILGPAVDGEEWRIGLAIAGLSVSRDLLEEMLRLRLARPHDEGWSFVHDLLRESLEKRARDGGRWAAHHRICAAAIRARGGPVSVERLGHYMLLAGDFDGALEQLTIGIRSRLAAGDGPLADALFEAWKEALARLDPPEDDSRHGLAAVFAAHLSFSAAQYDRAAERAEQARQLAKQHQWVELEAEALLCIAHAAHQLDDYDGSRVALAEIAPFADALEKRLESQYWVAVGRIDRDQGRIEQADRHFRRAQGICQSTGDERGATRAVLQQALCAEQAGRLDDARGLAHDALERAERLGMREALAIAHNSLGDMCRRSGEFADSERHYEAAIVLFEAVGAPSSALVTKVNLGLLYQQRDLHDQAGRRLAACLSPARGLRRSSLVAVIHVALLSTAARRNDWIGWDDHLAAAERLLMTMGRCDLDLALGATRAAELADRAEQRPRARRAWQLALAQWKGLERPHEAAEIAAQLLLRQD